MGKAQQNQVEQWPVLTSGTLNLVLADKNGFVIAADSRMSSKALFNCKGKRQSYCDDSQKLFRTSPDSAMVIAGFAVGSRNTPLDLTVASVLRKDFGRTGWPADQAHLVSGALKGELQDALTGVAALLDPMTSSSALAMTATLARRDSKGTPILQQVQFSESWVPMGPLNRLAPQYTATVYDEVLVTTRFYFVPVGITFVAEAIREGIYKSADPVIRNYYDCLKTASCADMSVAEMADLARVTLRETKNLPI